MKAIKTLSHLSTVRRLDLEDTTQTNEAMETETENLI